MQDLPDWRLLAQPSKATSPIPAVLSNHPLADLWTAIYEGRYLDVLRSDTGRHVLGLTGSTTEGTTYEDQLATQLANSPAEARAELHAGILAVGVALLQLFVQQGWTGPRLELDTAEIIPPVLANTLGAPADWTAALLKLLEVDGERAYHLTSDPYLLVLSRILLVRTLCGVADDDAEPAAEGPMAPPSAAWWAARCLRLHQSLLDENAATLASQIRTLQDRTGKILTATANQEDAPTLPESLRSELLARYYLERGLVNEIYDRHHESVADFTRAQEASGLQWKVTGALGRRTKFQKFDVSQLVVMAESASLDSQVDSNAKAASANDAKAPHTLALNDDTVLESIHYTDGGDPTEQGNLRIIDQCVLLAFCLNIKNTNPSDGLTFEQMKPYVSRVISHPNNWMVHTMALVLRSRLEAEGSRTVERSALQLQALVDQMPSAESHVTERLAYFYTLQLPSRWELEKELALRFASLGVFRSALEIFERLEMWDEVISCYQMLEQASVAEKIVRERLAVTPDDPKLLCLLGDLTNDPAHWERAWEVSGHRYARAMRSLGGRHYHEKRYSESIACYERALALNPLFENSWFMLGCAGLQVEDWATAARAFLRTTNLDPDNAEAWSNLASCYLRQDKKLDALGAFRMAARKHHDSWRIWSNYLYVSIDLGFFSEAIAALDRVIALSYPKRQDDCLDVDVLNTIVQAAIRDRVDVHGVPVGRQAAVIERLLVNSITTRITSVPRVWKICADFWFWQKRYAQALDAHLKAYRCLVTNPALDHDQAVFVEVAEGALELTDAYRNLGPLPATPDGDAVTAADWNYQARLILRSLIGRTKDTFGDHPLHDRLTETLAELKAPKT
ncbi:hypothetical protein IWQ60_007637 [Tieghemiomyces parasiticus]|uniref:TPR-like protein n=1 Tax=Tieghemiomyces parasiticus TaxID=78921 RepID=A0A9W8DTF6_9FUNG|nr:hypothetical protein IWQ60_007637 [Tieghemiomyces parasiticus]